MTIDTTASVAPKALTIKEILEVTADSMIIVGLSYRAFACAGLWNREGTALYSEAESAIENGRAEALANLESWLGDMKQDGDPRFFNKDKLDAELRNIALHYTKLFLSVGQAEVEKLVDELTGRDFNRLMAIAV